ncbi:transglycosylase SLT domain-containing protein [Chromobacterium paludis]|uniref:Transporter substrate-binding domain-containing protein n=1 Tax=Chromobacterium paludis TaxID=2605945 RepID=A0A5C1DEC9_9NEIS|nr:transporter substrate-binding domain-containing protein [Chromobacterium paludis]QEL55142.1 transporter substrate-binding domain-containing protein [Chromobacterium paludis]
MTRSCLLRCAVAIMLAAVAPAEARHLADILKTRQLRVCIAPIHAAVAVATPKGCREQCDFSGPVYEEVLAFARHLGKDIRVKTLRVDWDEQFFDRSGKTDREASYTPQLLANGTCDFYPSRLTKTAWRLKKLDFVTLFPSRMMVVANNAWRGRIRYGAQLAGLRTATEKDTSYHSWLQEQNHTLFASKPIKIELMPMADGLQALNAGNVDFMLLDADMAIWHTHHQLKNTYVAFPVGPKDEIGWAFRKEDKDLQAAVARYFDEQRQNQDSDFNRIWLHYHGRTLTDFIALLAAVN